MVHMINGAGDIIVQLHSNIKAIVVRSAAFKNAKDVTDEAYIDYVMKNSVTHRIAVIKAKSPILQKIAHSGEIKIAGACCDLITGRSKILQINIFMPKHDSDWQ